MEKASTVKIFDETTTTTTTKRKKKKERKEFERTFLTCLLSHYIP